MRGELRLVTTRHEALCVVRVIGDLDIDTSPRLRDELLALIAEEEKDIVVDMAALEFFDSTGMGVLIGALKRQQSRDRTVVLRSPRPATRRVLEATGLDTIFEITA